VESDVTTRNVCATLRHFHLRWWRVRAPWGTDPFLHSGIISFTNWEEIQLQNNQLPDSNRTRSRGKVIALALGALVIFTATAIALTYPLATDMSHNYFNPIGSHDGVGTIGGMWSNDYARKNGFVKGNVTTFYAYPFGYDTRGVSYPLTNGVLNLAAKAFGAQASYNFLTLITFPMAGLFMVLLLYYITSSAAASFLGGFFYAFSPWHTARTFDQVGLAQIYVLPLFLLAVIVFWRKRNITSALTVSGAMLVAILTDFHLGLFCGLILIAWGMAAFLKERAASGNFITSRNLFNKRDALRAIIMAALAVALALGLSAPFISNLFYKDPAVTVSAQERTIETTTSYSSHPWNYVVPPAYSLMWRSWTTNFVLKHIGKSGAHEMTAYPGIVAYCLAGLAIFFTLRRKRKPLNEFSSPSRGESCIPHPNPLSQGAKESEGTTVYFGVLTATLAFILSMPPIVKIRGVDVPTPSIAMRALASYFRFYSRWALVVTFSIALMAGVGFFLLTRSRRWSGLKAGAACLALIALFAVDVTIIPPLRSRDITKVPSVVTELARYPKGEPVAFYPLSPGRYHIPLQYFYFQMFHEHPMMNGVKPGTDGDMYQSVLKDIYAPYTPAMLKSLGIKKIVVIDEYFKIMFPVGLTFDPKQMPSGYRLAKKTSDGYIFDVVGPAANVFPLYYMNFTSPAILEDGKAWAMTVRPHAELLIENKAGDTRKDFSITFTNPGNAGTISVRLDGQNLGQVKVAPGPGELRIPGVHLTRKRQMLSFEWDGPPVKTSGKPYKIEGNVDSYLLVTRPQFAEYTVDGNP